MTTAQALDAADGPRCSTPEVLLPPPFAAALRSVQVDQAYWQEQFQSAIAAGDRNRADEALRSWRECQSLIDWCEKQRAS